MEHQYISIFWGIILLIGIAKCVKIAKRETTSRVCVYALMMSLIGLLISFAFQEIRFSGPQARLYRFALAVLCLSTFLSAVIIGIIGLAQYSAHDTFRQGRKQAIGAIVLSLIFISIAGFGGYNTFKERNAATGFPTPQATAAGITQLDDLNFQYESPGKPYVVLDPGTLSKDASFAMLRKSPLLYFTIIAEKIGFEGADQTERIVKIVQANMQSTATQCRFSDQKPYEVNGLKGIRYRAEAQVKGIMLSYAFWVIEKNGYSYQLLTFGKIKDRDQVWQESEKLFANFKQIEPDRVYYADGSQPFGSFTSDLFGYSLDLRRTPWMRLEKVAEQYPEAEVGAKIGEDAAAIVVPVFYADDRPGLEAFFESMLKIVGFDYPVNAIKNRRSIQVAGMSGYDLRYGFDSDSKKYEMRCKILSGAHYGYLAAAWVAVNSPDKEKLFDQFFSPLHFTPPTAGSFTANMLSEPQKQAQARIINQIGLYYYRSKVYNTALRYFKTASRTLPEKTIYLSNCLDSFNQLGQNAEALVFLNQNKGYRHENPDLLSWEAWHLKQTGQIDRALTIYERLFSGDYKIEEDFNIYSQLLAEQKQWEKLEKAYGSYVKKSDTIEFRLQHAKLLQEHGNHNGAIRILQALQDEVPLNSKIAFPLIQNYNAVGQPRKSLEISQALIAKGLGSADAYYYKGDAEYRLKWYRKAKQSLEKALALAPQDNDIKDYIQQVSARLGQGNNTSVKSPIEQVALPEIIRKKLPSIDTAQQQGGFDSYYLNIIDGFTFTTGEEYRHTTYKRIKVLDASGVSRFSTLQMRFNPLFEEIYVNELIVRDEIGRVVSRGDPDDFYTIDTQKDQMATYDRTLCVPVPNLQPGYTIEITSTKKTISAPKSFPFERTIIGASRPVLLGAVFCTGDTDALRFRQTNIAAPIQIPEGLVWLLENPPIYRWEPSMVDYETFMAVVLLGNADQTWEQLGKGYLAKIKDKLILDDATRNLAKRLVENDPTTTAKIASLARYVQTQYAYKAIEFGSRGLIPNSADLTIKNKYGDCKDHALLLHQLLQAVSIPSHLALVNTESDIADPLPSLDQFNHMILFVPSDQGGRFFDMTDKDLDPWLSAPAGLANRASLVLDPQHIHFGRIPAYSNNNGLSSRRDIEIMAGGDLHVTENVRFNGYTAGFMRGELKSVEKAKMQGWLQDIISNYESSARLVSFHLSNLFDNSQALVLDLSYEIKGRPRTFADRLNFRSPGVWEHYYLDVQPREARMRSFEITYPFSLQTKVSIKAPSGYVFEDVPDDGSKGQAAFGKWHVRIDPTTSKIHQEFACSLASGVFGPEKYSDYHDMMVRAVGSISQDLTCEKARSIAQSK